MPPTASGGAVLTRKRHHLEGLAYYVVYVPAMFVAAVCALLFVAAVERYLFDDEDDN